MNTLPKQAGESEPLHRLFSREGAIGRKLLDQVRKDLSDVVKVCQGELKQTNHLRTLMSSLTKGTSPLFLLFFLLADRSPRLPLRHDPNPLAALQGSQNDGGLCMDRGPVAASRAAGGDRQRSWKPAQF